jgi:predicted RNase H-like HicB family nuclease
MVPIEFDLVIFREGATFIAYCPELDVSSCGASADQARVNLKTAVRLFLEEAEKMGTLRDVLAEAGYRQDDSGRWNAPPMVAVESARMGLLPKHLQPRRGVLR